MTLARMLELDSKQQCSMRLGWVWRRNKIFTTLNFRECDRIFPFPNPHHVSLKLAALSWHVRLFLAVDYLSLTNKHIILSTCTVKGT